MTGGRSLGILPKMKKVNFSLDTLTPSAVLQHTQSSPFAPYPKKTQFSEESQRFSRKRGLVLFCDVNLVGRAEP